MLSYLRMLVSDHATCRPARKSHLHCCPLARSLFHSWTARWCGTTDRRYPCCHGRCREVSHMKLLCKYNKRRDLANCSRTSMHWTSQALCTHFISDCGFSGLVRPDKIKCIATLYWAKLRRSSLSLTKGILFKQEATLLYFSCRAVHCTPMQLVRTQQGIERDRQER